MPNIIQLMIDRGIISRTDLQKILPTGKLAEPPYRTAVKTGLVSEDTFLSLAGEVFNLPLVSELEPGYESQSFESLSPSLMEQYCFFPLQLNDNTLHIAVNDPFNHQLLENLKQFFPQAAISFHLARESNIRNWISEYFTPEEPTLPDDTADEENTSFFISEDIDHLKDLASEAPIIKLVNQFLTRGVEAGASDVHIEPFADRLQVRFRIDGILHEHAQPAASLQQAITSRIKIMAKMDIAERRLPQDGRIRMKIAGKDIDLRVSCLPVMYGESIVMRILDRSQISYKLENLGFPTFELQQFQNLLARSYGIILVTGPTGSGKTTTLYAALNSINTPDKKIITIEDPVEYELAGINQMEVNPKAGLTFAHGLRSIVRQDPDVILIGEIRDRETADIAIQSALTGHLVFSTLHTNDAAGAVTRLIEIGVEDYLLSSSLIGIMAQRLVRILCPVCKEAFTPTPELLKKVGLSVSAHDDQLFYKPKGCKSCSFSGYRGRTAIFELLPVSDTIRHLILGAKASTVIRDAALAEGMTLLRSDGWRKVKNGVTSIEEVLRVT